MKIKEIQKRGDNLYSLTYEVGFWIFKKEITRDVYVYYNFVYFADDDLLVENYRSVKNLIKHLNDYQPLKIK